MGWSIISAYREKDLLQESIELDIDRRDDLAKILAAISWELWHE